MNAKLVNTESALTSARTAMEIFAARGCQRVVALDAARPGLVDQ